MATFWEIAAHLVDNMFSFVFWLIVILVISRFGFEGWLWVLMASVPDLCILFTFLRRNLSGCQRNIKAQWYETMVRPTLEYTFTVWDPVMQRNIKKVEPVQRRATRIAFSDYRHTSSHSQMIEDLGWQSLQNRRSNAKVVMFNRITYGLVDKPATSFFYATSNNTRGHSLRYLVPYCHTETYSNSFFPSGICLWNQLPEDLSGHLLGNSCPLG